MTTFLLDANVLIALIDPAHVYHDDAHGWFAAEGHRSWATCPLTENAVLRVVGHARYPNGPGTPSVVVPVVAQLRSLPGHRFWPDNISLLDNAHFDPARLLSTGQITDSYLLALARANKGQLATFDRRLVTDAVPDGRQHLRLIA
ncbi:MAG: PIN domain-containing protein [Rhodospirillales bacterium]|nr:PIN domain-containing protein [Acetobacter sp.]